MSAIAPYLHLYSPRDSNSDLRAFKTPTSAVGLEELVLLQGFEP